MSLRFAIVLSCVTGCGYVTVSHAQASRALNSEANTPGSIEGLLRVKGSNKPAANVTVAIRESNLTTTTDENGHYVFPTVMPGTWTLIASGPGYGRTRITDVVVRPGAELTLSRQYVASRTSDQDPLQLDEFVVSAKQSGVVELDPYEVSGRKEKAFTSNMDIPRTINDVQPYYIFDSKTIDTSGAANFTDFLKERLTMNTVAQTYGQAGGLYRLNGNRSEINLRGLGADKTLILINGRRAAGVSIQNTEYQPDLNGIPLGAIERIEVLPASASGIYGGSALGGVVNVVLKQNYSGGQLSFNYDNAWDTDVAKRTFSANYGFTLEGGKTQVMLNASWSDANTLLLQDRSKIFAENFAAIRRNEPTFFDGDVTPWLGSVPNIASWNDFYGQPLVLKNGTSLGSNKTYVPAGTTANTPAATLISGLIANAGHWNFDLPLTTQEKTGLLRPRGVTPKTSYFQGNVRRHMLSWLEAFAELTYSKNSSYTLNSPVSNNQITVPGSSPANPFINDVLVQVPINLDVPISTESVSRSATIGVIAQLPAQWTVEFDYTFSESRYKFTDWAHDGPARDRDLESGVLNPFVDTLASGFPFDRYLYPTYYSGRSQMDDVELRGNGLLPSLPWGQPSITSGIGYRVSHIPGQVTYDEYPITKKYSSKATYYPHDAVTSSGYTELLVPMLRQDSFRFVHNLQAQLSGRVEKYTVDTGTYGEQSIPNWTPPIFRYLGTVRNGLPYYEKASYTSKNYTVGFKYEPTRDLIIRASRATAFLPPTPTQLSPNNEPSSRTSNVFDPKQNRTVGVLTIGGGNPDLEPQNSKSTNIGLVWAPSAGTLKGLRLNLEYYRIEQFGYITTISTQQIVNNEALFPGRVVRDSTGTIVSVNTSYLNLNHRDTKGFDLSAEYSINTGAGIFDFRAAATRIGTLKEQLAFGGPEWDYAGYPNESGVLYGALRYKGNASINWRRNNWSAGWTARYFGSYPQFGVPGGPISQQYNNGTTAFAPYIGAAQGGYHIRSQTYHDLFVGYNFGQKTGDDSQAQRPRWKKWADGISVNVGVRNVFATKPPLDVTQEDNYYLSPYGDFLLRTYWISLKKSF